MLRVVHIRNKKRTDKQTWNFTNMINCFYCYVIKSAGEIIKKVLLSIFWNLLIIEINLSQIRILDSKCENVCAVCLYLFFFFSSANPLHFTCTMQIDDTWSLHKPVFNQFWIVGRMIVLWNYIGCIQPPYQPFISKTIRYWLFAKRIDW